MGLSITYQYQQCNYKRTPHADTHYHILRTQTPPANAQREVHIKANTKIECSCVSFACGCWIQVHSTQNYDTQTQFISNAIPLSTTAYCVYKLRKLNATMENARWMIQRQTIMFCNIHQDFAFPMSNIQRERDKNGCTTHISHDVVRSDWPL